MPFDVKNVFFTRFPVSWIDAPEAENIWQFAVILVLVPTLCRGGRGGTRLYDILSGTRLPGTRSICIVFVLVYEIWHKVSIPTLAQG